MRIPFGWLDMARLSFQGRTQRTAAFGVVVGCGALLIAGGCGQRSGSLLNGGSATTQPGPTRVIQPTEFRSQPGEVDTIVTLNEADSNSGDDANLAPLIPPPTEPDSLGAGDPGAVAGRTNQPGAGEVRTVAGLIGQVNGRPIYIDDFFQPIADYLANIGREQDYATFVQTAARLIKLRLDTVIDNELLLAEAQSLLTSSEQAGVRFLKERIRGQLILSYGGSEGEANRRLIEETGVGLDEQVEQYHRQILIRDKVIKQIDSGVSVTWRDIERYYESNEAEFNPPPSIQLRLILVRDADDDTVSTINRKLASLEPFESVAEQYSRYRPADGGLMGDPILLTGGIENTELTAWPEVDQGVRGLGEGEYAGPFMVGNNGTTAVWAYVELFSDGQGSSLFESQAKIKQLLEERQREDKRAAYYDKLRSRGNYDDKETMLIKLLEISIERWAPPRL